MCYAPLCIFYTAGHSVLPRPPRPRPRGASTSRSRYEPPPRLPLISRAAQMTTRVCRARPRTLASARSRRCPSAASTAPTRRVARLATRASRRWSTATAPSPAECARLPLDTPFNVLFCGCQLIMMVVPQVGRDGADAMVQLQGEGRHHPPALV